MFKRYLLGITLIGAAASIVACSTVAQHAENAVPQNREIANQREGYFGYRGSPGYPGQSGYPGVAGQDQIINVSDGKSLTISAVGGDASNGGNGENGGNATNCVQPMVTHDLIGAPGGDGGSAGAGGTGGHGGDLTIYYTADSQLKNVFVNAAGGRGGQPGNPALGGAGCMCQRNQWTVERQECPPPPRAEPGKPVPPTPPCRIYVDRYDCHHGIHGATGNGYYDPTGHLIPGLDGAPGQVVLIKSKTQIPLDHPVESVDVGTLPAARTTLLANNFATATGMIGKLQGGSIVQDEYQYFTKTITKTVTYKWNAEGQPSDFAGQHLVVRMDSDGNVTAGAATGQAMWAEVVVTNSATGALVEINHVANANTLFDFDGTIIGDGVNTQLLLTDKSGIGSFVGTEFSLNVRSGGGFIGFIMTGRYNGHIDPQFITQATNTDASGKKTNTLTIAVGKLPGIKAKKLWAHKKIKIAATISRTLGGQAASQTFEIDRKSE